MSTETKTDTETLQSALADDGKEWHIPTDWNDRLAICGCSLERGPGLPSEEVPDHDTCPKCLSVEQSVLYRYGTSPLHRCKVWLVG